MKFFVFFGVLALALAESSTMSNDTQQPSDITIEVSSQEGSKPQVVKSTLMESAASVAPNLMPKIMQAIEIFEFVQKFSNGANDGFGVAKVHSTSLTIGPEEVDESSQARSHDKRSSVTASGKDMMKTIDPVTMVISALVFLAHKLSTLLFHVIPENEYFRYNDHFYHVDYNTISDSIRELPVKGFNMFDIREEECQSRAMCEIGQSIGGFFPDLAKGLRFLIERLNLKDLTSEALVRGFGWSDCDKSFKKKCPKSPFKKLQQLVQTFTKLY